MGNKKQRIYIKGFTLSELLISVSIIAILVLMAILTLNYKTQIQKARDAKRKNDLKLIQNKLEDYFNDNNGYPSPPCSGECCKISCESNFLSPYLEKFPCDPQKKEYVYCADSLKSRFYKIYTNLEYKNDKDLKISGCENGCLVGDSCYNYGVGSSNVGITTAVFCEGNGPSPTIITAPTGTVRYYGCQEGRCNVVDQERCGIVVPVCVINDDTCNNCSLEGCNPYPSCLE